MDQTVYTNVSIVEMIPVTISRRNASMDVRKDILEKDVINVC